MKTRAYHINTELKTVTECLVDTLEDLQALVGGRIERALELENGDEIFVNEEGLFDESTDFFIVEFNGRDLLFRGNGFLTGPTNSKGEATGVETTLRNFENMIYFKSKEDILSE